MLKLLRPKISIITICFNEVKTISKTLASVYTQSYKEFEHIIIDGGSTDGTLDKIKEHDFPNRLIVSEKDRGISDAFNKGAQLARGDFVIYLNAGDIFSKYDVVERSVENIIEYNDYSSMIFYGDHILAYNGSSRLVKANHTLMGSHCSICHQSVFVGRKIYKSMHYDLRLSMAMDHDYWLRALKAYPFVPLNIPVSISAWGGASSDSRRFVKNMIEILVVRLINHQEEFTVPALLSNIAKIHIRSGKEKLRCLLGESIFVHLKSLIGRPPR